MPPPFLTEPSGLAGVDGNQRGTRMHHKFIVLDFDKPTARVYLGSYNFSNPADDENGENLVVVRDRTVATSYMIEALRMYDHYIFRVASEASNGPARPLELKRRLSPAARRGSNATGPTPSAPGTGSCLPGRSNVAGHDGP